MQDKLSVPLLIFSLSFFVVSIFGLRSNPTISEKQELVEIAGLLKEHSIRKGRKGNKYLSITIQNNNKLFTVDTFHTRESGKLIAVNERLLNTKPIFVLVKDLVVLDKNPKVWHLEQSSIELIQFNDTKKLRDKSRTNNYIFLLCGIILSLVIIYREIITRYRN
jgi:hypothetical protein